MDELLGRRAPYSAPAEQAVLGSMLIDPRCIPEVIGKVKSQDFYIQTNREIFETMFSMFSFGRNIDPVTVMGEMKSRGVFKDDSTEQYLRELMDITPTAANVLEYAAIVSDRALQRALAQAADEIQKLVYEGAGVLSGTDIRIDDNPSLTVSEMNAQCRRLKNLGLIVIDYLQLMQSAGSGNSWANESRTQAVSDISRMIKIMAKELGVPVLCLSQLSRANESRQNKRPMLSDLRESGAIEQDADVVMGIYREGYYNAECENPNEAELIILKNRRGQTGTINLMWLPEYTSFVAVDRRHDDD